MNHRVRSHGRRADHLTHRPSMLPRFGAGRPPTQLPSGETCGMRVTASVRLQSRRLRAGQQRNWACNRSQNGDVIVMVATTTHFTTRVDFSGTRRGSAMHAPVECPTPHRRVTAPQQCAPISTGARRSIWYRRRARGIPATPCFARCCPAWRSRPGSPRGIPLEHGICRRECVSIPVYIYVVPRL